MLIGAVMLRNVQGVNSFQRNTQVMLRQGNPATVYFQLVDLEQADQNGTYLRYIPAAGASITGSISSINQQYVVQRLASQPFSQDLSIWAMNLLATDTITTGNFMFTLAEGSLVRTGYVQNAIIVQTTNPSIC